VSQIWIFSVQDYKKPLQDWNRLYKADAANAITAVQRKCYSQLIVGGELFIWVMVIDDDGKRRRICQHVRDRNPISAKDGKAKEGCRVEHEVPPSTANFHDTIPPTLVIPGPSS
jgi:hypothetical protein